jgi:hypothetical protein
MLIMSCDDVDQPGWDVSTGAGRLNAARALHADPKHFLHTQITNIAKEQREGKPVVVVSGAAIGTHLRTRKLLVAFGKNPGRDDWKEVYSSRNVIVEGVLGEVPATTFGRRGVWSVRTVVEDEKGATRLATVAVEIE